MTPARILIVEDEQITAADIEDILQDFGYQVTAVATSGESAIRQAELTQPDLALMDIRIRGKVDGIEAAREIRRRFGIPSIYLTAHADDATLERAKESEPLGYIVKPFHNSELQAVIQMALHKLKADRATERKRAELEATLDSLGEAVIRLDAMGRVVFLNPAAEKWTGWKGGDAIERHVSEVFPLLDGVDRRPLDAFLSRAVHEPAMTELPPGCTLRSRTGMERAVAGNVAPVRDPSDGVSGAVIAFGKIREVAVDSRAKDRAPALKRADEDEDRGMVVASETMRKLMKFARRIASSGVTAILLEGESGTGKDVLARFLHRAGKRRDGPFIAVNCAAIPETLMESELFGYEKGAFTDARAQKKGVFDLADGGTILLDEIGELQPPLQAKLLRVLEDQSFRRLGGVKDIEVDVRIIAATNKNLSEAVRRKEFREDLYYRLNVIQISIPPIREHKEDILPIVRYFIDRYNTRFEREIEGLSPEAERILTAHDWPGNVREIRNAIERAMVLEESPILEAENFKTQAEAAHGVDGPARAAPGGASLEDVERSMLVQALEQCGGNQTRAAKTLGISRDTLRYRVKKYKLK